MRAGLRYHPFSIIIIAVFLCACRQSSSTPRGPSAQGKAAMQSIESSINSGVLGFAGAGAPFSDPEGIIGECIWIFDANNRTQVAQGDCAESTPGKFRVPLRPGHYVVRGPGGNRSIEVKAGRWVKVESVA